MDVTFRDDLLNDSTVSSKVFNQNSYAINQDLAEEIQDSLNGSSFDPTKYNLYQQIKRNGEKPDGRDSNMLIVDSDEVQQQ